MDSMEYAFVELGNAIEKVSKEITDEIEKAFRQLLEFIIEVFNKYKERYLTK